MCPTTKRVTVAVHIVVRSQEAMTEDITGVCFDTKEDADGCKVLLRF
jgi:hypothetical protein